MARNEQHVAAVKREPFFECVFVSEQNEYRFHLRAWTAADAEQVLADELRANGVTSRGELRILDSKGRVTRRGKYPLDVARGP